jgi:hypothetical protein
MPMSISRLLPCTRSPSMSIYVVTFYSITLGQAKRMVLMCLISVLGVHTMLISSGVCTDKLYCITLCCSVSQRQTAQAAWMSPLCKRALPMYDSLQSSLLVKINKNVHTYSTNNPRKKLLYQQEHILQVFSFCDIASVDRVIFTIFTY